MEEYKSNSHKSKAEQAEKKMIPAEKKVEKIANGRVRKKSRINKVASNFINEDVDNIKSYVVFDVLIPAAKKAISDIVVNGIDMILYGETGRSDRRGRRVDSSFVRYDRCSSSSSRRDERDRDRFERRRPLFDDIVYDTRGEAEEVLNRMDELIETYHMVSVFDMFDLSGIDCDYTLNNYGWTKINTAEVVRIRDRDGEGYIIKLPRAVPID